MDVITHVNEYYKLYSVIALLIAMAAMYWLSQRFVPKKDFEKFKQETETAISAQQKTNTKINETLVRLDADIKNLPKSGDVTELTRQIAFLNGKMEGSNPLINQLLKNDEMLIQNELNGEKK